VKTNITIPSDLRDIEGYTKAWCVGKPAYDSKADALHIGSDSNNRRRK
jgi:hypothetical protein